MKKIFHQIKSSIYNPNFYQSLQTKTLGFSLSYYFRFSLCLALLVTILASLILVPITVDLFGEMRRTLPGLYPADLEITITAGDLAINQPEPYFIDFPVDSSDLIKTKFKHLIAIDTTSKEPAQKYNEYQALFLVTKNHLVYRELVDNEADLAPLVTQALPTDLNLKIDQVTALAMFEKISGYFVFLPPLLALGLFIAVLFINLVVLVYLVILAVLFWLVARFFTKERLAFSFIYRAMVHASTLGLLLELLLVIFSASSLMPLILTIVTLAVLTINLSPRFAKPELNS